MQPERESYLTFIYYEFESEKINIVELMNNIAYGGDPIARFHKGMQNHIEMIK